MDGIQCGEVEFQNCSSLVSSWYIPVHTGTYWYVQVQTSTKQHTSLDHALSALRRLRVSAKRLAWSFRTVSFRMAVSSTVRPPRRGLPRPKFHSQALTSYTLLPRLPSEDAESAQPMGNPEPLCLLNLCIWILADVRCRTSEVRHRIIPMLHTMSYVRYVRHRNIRCRSTYDIATIRCRMFIRHRMV